MAELLWVPVKEQAWLQHQSVPGLLAVVPLYRLAGARAAVLEETLSYSEGILEAQPASTLS